MNFSAAMLPDDAANATLAGRLLLDEGPTPVLIRDGAVEDVSRQRADYRRPDGPVPIREASAASGCSASTSCALPAARVSSRRSTCRQSRRPGVTFAISAIERVIEERARGDFRAAAAEIRDKLEQRIGGAIRSVVPGSEAAARLKEALIEDGLWSQYLEVAIGPDAEIFTKTAPLASVGWGAEIGVRSEFELEQSRARSRAGREQPRRDPRRDARQRREPARFRRPQRAAAEQGEGQ